VKRQGVDEKSPPKEAQPAAVGAHSSLKEPSAKTLSGMVRRSISLTSVILKRGGN
jgi:hypothetical protein